MAILNGQKQQLLNQVKNNPGVELQTLVKLLNQYDDLKIEDFKGYISDILYVQLLEAGRDPREMELWNRIENAPKNAPEEIQNLQRMVSQYMQQYSQGPKFNEAQSLMVTLQQEMQEAMRRKQEEIAAQREQNDWIALERGNYNALHLYKQKYPNSVHSDELDDLMWTNSTLVITMHSLNRYLSDWPMGKHAEEARKALEEISEWDSVKRRRKLFEVDDYRDNHPFSVFKYEIDMLYYELRDEELKNMKTCPTEYSKDDIEKLMAADIFKLEDLIDYELMTEESWEILQRGRDEFPDIAQYQIEDPNLKAPEKCTDIFLFGTPGTGKTCLLMGLAGANGRGYTLNMRLQGGTYASALQEYVRAGITPGRTYGQFVTVINGKVNETDKKGNIISHPINLVEMSGEEFALRIADAKGVTLADMGTGATNLLRNQNRKAFFIIVDPTRLKVKVDYRKETRDASGNVIGYDIRTKWVSQLDILNKFVSLFELEENQEIMANVDAIHFVVTKADTLGETDKERQRKAKELLLDIYEGPVQQLKDYCRRSKRVNYSTNYDPYVFTFSLGNFYLGDVFNFDSTETLQIVESIRSLTSGLKEETWWEKVKRKLN